MLIFLLITFMAGNSRSTRTIRRPGRAMNRRVHGWALKLQDYQFKIVYRRRVANANADGLTHQATDGEDAEDGCPAKYGGMWGHTPTRERELGT